MTAHPPLDRIGSLGQVPSAVNDHSMPQIPLAVCRHFRAAAGRRQRWRAVLLLVTLVTVAAVLPRPARGVDPFAPRRDDLGSSASSTTNRTAAFQAEPPADARGGGFRRETRATATAQRASQRDESFVPRGLHEAATGETAVLVLEGGRLAEGRLEQTSAGFLVHKPGGRMLIPDDRIRFRARDRQHAWQLVRNAAGDLSPDRHVALARWCLTCELYDEARYELRAALEEEPSHRAARSMLVRLQGLLDPSSIESPVPPRSETRTADGFEKTEARSLAGLSRDSAKTFVTVVQPLLLNSCGNSSCHGGETASTFRLANVRSGQSGHRIFAERNLAAVMGQVTLDDPAASPLLTVPRNGHGRNGRTVFNGAGGKRAQQQLARWVSVVSAEQTGRAVPGGSSGRLANRGGRNRGPLRKTGNAYDPFSRIPWRRTGSTGAVPAGSELAPVAAEATVFNGRNRQQNGQSLSSPDAAAVAAFRRGDLRAAGMALRSRLPGGQQTPNVQPALPVRPPEPLGGLPVSATDELPDRSSNVDQALAAEQPDPFDPAAFNRQSGVSGPAEP